MLSTLARRDNFVRCDEVRTCACSSVFPALKKVDHNVNFYVLILYVYMYVCLVCIYKKAVRRF